MMYKVFNQRLAGYLMLHGFRLIRIAQNDHVPQLNVFVFEKSKDLLDTMSQYQISKG